MAGSELSRPFPVAKIPESGEAFHIEATPEERAALARRFELVDLPALEAEGEIAVFDHGHRARVEGVVRARVVQTCVVTLEPVAATVEDTFVRTYSAAASRPTSLEPETVVELDEEEPPEPLTGGAVDIGEAIAETLGLALDPYPRTPGVSFGGDAGGDRQVPPGNGPDSTENRRESPFNALRGLVKKP